MDATPSEQTPGPSPRYTASTSKTCPPIEFVITSPPPKTSLSSGSTRRGNGNSPTPLGTHPLLGERLEHRQFTHQCSLGNRRRETVLPSGVQGPPLSRPGRRLLRVEEGRRLESSLLLHPQVRCSLRLPGLWERWQKDDSIIESCTLLTTEANTVVSPIHQRMPVILDAEGCSHWLNPRESAESLKSLLTSLPADLMNSPDR